jgi:hypothetical protein
MDLDSPASVTNYTAYKNLLKSGLKAVKTHKLYFRYFRRFTFDDGKVRPILLFGSQSVVDYFVESLAKGRIKDEPDDDAGSKSGKAPAVSPEKRPAPKNAGIGKCFRPAEAPTTIVFSVSKGEIRQADLVKIFKKLNLSTQPIVQ